MNQSMQPSQWWKSVVRRLRLSKVKLMSLIVVLQFKSEIFCPDKKQSNKLKFMYSCFHYSEIGLRRPLKGREKVITLGR